MGKRLDLIGEKFNRLTVISYAGIVGTPGSTKATWNCICDCGNKVIIRGTDLKSQKTQSCGCFQKETLLRVNTKHGMCGTQFHNIWKNINARCLDVRSNNYKYYGKRGIKVCQRWLTFINFKNDMYKSYLKHKENHKETTIERKDNNGNYCLGNCTWATRKEQSRNNRHNRMIAYQGKNMCLADWANTLGIERSTLAYRLNQYPPQIAFNVRR